MKFCSYAQLLLAFLVLSSLCGSCKKEAEPEPERSQRTNEQLLKDSVYYYFMRYSLWSNGATADQKAVAAYTDAYNTPSEVLEALKGETPAFAAYNGSIDRFSYLENDGNSGLQAASDAHASRGFGLFFSIGAGNDEMAYPVVYFVEGGSPAHRAGIRRSDLVLEINAQDLGIPIRCRDGSCTILDAAKKQNVVNALLTALEQQQMKVRLRHADDTELSFSLNAAAYEIDPIVKERVFDYSSKRIGYLALSSFEEVKPGQQIQQHLDRVFAKFEDRQIDALILDLRYNTGGYISSAQYIANKVITPVASDALMYKYELNAFLSQRSNWKGQSFEDVYFQRSGNLNLKTVYFLVTDITASASELLINVLRPYMNVVIIAENEGTYGKPVGFFKQEIMGETALWAASFKLINSRGESDYWDGINADQKNIADYIFADFGDPEESMLSAAFTHSLAGQKPSETMSIFKKPVKTRKIRIAQVNAIPQTNMFR